MNMTVLTNINIRDISCSVPAAQLSNLENPYFDTDKKQKISSNIGVTNRYITNSEQCTSDLCIEAASCIIKESLIDITQIGILVFITQTPDFVLPATSCIIQNKLGLANDTIAFDVNLGCSGYIYGLYLVSSLLKTNNKKYGLLLVGDTISKLISPQDSSSTFLFGDAGSATLLEKCEVSEKMLFSLGTDGSGWSNLIVPGGGFRHRYDKNTSDMLTDNDGNARSKEHLFMDGMEIFNFTIATVVPHIADMLRQSDEIDAVVFHQANRFMLEFMRKSLQIPNNNFLYSLGEYGNTSSASIPLTICTHADQVHNARKTLLSGFGVGYSWGSVITSLSRTTIHKTITLSR